MTTKQKQHVKGYKVKKTRITYTRKKEVSCYTRTVTRKKRKGRQSTL